MPKEIKHLAIIRLSAMGDVAMTVPVIRAFAHQYPKVKITFISRPFFKPFFEGIPNLTFFEFDAQERHKGLIGLIWLFLDLRRLKMDGFADLHNVLRSKVIRMLFALSGKNIAHTDKGRAEKKALTRPEKKVFLPLKSMFERHAITFKKLGFNIDLSQSVFPEKPVLSPTILNVIGEKTQTINTKLIGIAPFAQYESKVYPADLMQQVIDILAAHEEYKILLFGGGKKEIAILEGFAQGKRNVITIAGKIKFHEELQLISHLDVMLAMDSGNGHIAAMLGVKVITLWGATHPFAGFVPFNQPLENALVSDRDQFPKLPTSVYGNKKVEGYEDVMRTIPVTMIVEKIKMRLEEL
ncbi:MAG TPA: glycosyltransferase family 9 protein [Flavobacterium sp.]|jgi:ADP-heptose:LPS heptosyltransferase